MCFFFLKKKKIAFLGRFIIFCFWIGFDVERLMFVHQALTF